MPILLPSVCGFLSPWGRQMSRIVRRRKRRWRAPPCCGAPAAVFIERWRIGDVTALQDVLTRFHCRFARRLQRKYGALIAYEDAEDAVLRAAANAWRGRDTFDPQRGTFEQWFWRIADHAAAEIARESWCQSRRHETRLLIDEASVPPLGALTSGEAGSASAELENAMQVLSDTERYVLWADACSPNGVADDRDIAERRGIAESTVRCNRARGRAKLKDELARQGYEPPCRKTI